MEINKLKTFFNEIILDRFLMNFFPGLILYFLLTILIDFTAGEGIISAIIVSSTSWILGLIVELCFFRKEYSKRREASAFKIKETINLFLGKIGLSIVLTCVIIVLISTISINLKLIDVFNLKYFTTIFKLLCFGGSGIALYFFYWYNRSNIVE